MKDPRVAVVVRTKDRPEFLERALRSIAAQTMGEWECVIVNDGGDAETVDRLVKAHVGLISRMRVIHAGTTRGRWKSANAGVLATSAPLLVLHDDDDSWHPEFLGRATDYLEAQPERDGVVARIQIVWEQRGESGFTVVDREVFQPQLNDALLSDALLFNRYVPIGFVYRRALHEDLGLYDDRLPVVGDWAFTLKVLSRGPLEYLGDEPLAYWHQRVGARGSEGNSVTDSRDDHVKYDALIRDDALRSHVADNGLGLVLYLTKFIDQRFIDVENGIRREIIDSSTWNRARGKAGRTLARVLPWRRR